MLRTLRHERACPEPRARYERWHDRFAVDASVETPWHALILEHLGPADLAGKRVLEIACGRGGLACRLAGQPLRPACLVAADFSQAAVAKGKAFAATHHVSGIHWELSDIQKIGHADASFDTVISCETIEHVPDPRSALRELTRVLKPGGRLLLTTPNYLGSLGLYRLYLRLRGRRYSEEGQPINRFMLLPLTVARVKRAGLRVTAIDAVGHYLLWPGRPPIEVPRLNDPRVLMRWFGLHSLVVAEKI